MNKNNCILNALFIYIKIHFFKTLTTNNRLLVVFFFNLKNLKYKNIQISDTK